jgi:hypothetical protein
MSLCCMHLSKDFGVDTSNSARVHFYADPGTWVQKRWVRISYNVQIYYSTFYTVNKPGQKANGSQFGEGRLSSAAIVILIAFRLTLGIADLSSLSYDIGIYVCVSVLICGAVTYWKSESPTQAFLSIRSPGRHPGLPRLKLPRKQRALWYTCCYIRLCDAAG